MAAGEVRELRLSLALQTQGPVPEPAPPAPKPDDDHAASWVLGAVGAGALVAGGVLTALAWDDVAAIDSLHEQHAGGTAPPDVVRREAVLRDRAQDREVAAWVLYGVGAVAVGSAIALAVVGESAPNASADLVISPAAAGRGATVGLRGAF